MSIYSNGNEGMEQDRRKESSQNSDVFILDNSNITGTLNSKNNSFYDHS